MLPAVVALASLVSLESLGDLDVVDKLAFETSLVAGNCREVG